MTVLPFEGTYPILYREFDLPSGSGLTTGYLARPDQYGEFPVVIVLAGIDGITPSLKDLCRQLARHGFSAVAPDLTRGDHPGEDASLEAKIAAYQAIPDRRALADIDDTYWFCMQDDADWALDGPAGVFGVDTGGRFALLYAATRDHVAAVSVAYAPLGGDDERDYSVADALRSMRLPVLGLYGDQDELIPVESVDAAQQLNPHGRWLLYQGVGHEFLDADDAAYHDSAAKDALHRLYGWMESQLPKGIRKYA